MEYGDWSCGVFNSHVFINAYGTRIAEQALGMVLARFPFN